MLSSLVILLLLGAVTSQDDDFRHFETKNFKSDVTLDEISDEFTTFRLPNDTYPVRYDIWLKTDVDRGIFDFEGRVNIRVKALEYVNNVVLHYRQITINSVQIKYGDNVTVLDLDFEIVPAFEFINIFLPRQFPKDGQFDLILAYNGTLRTSAGFYRGFFTQDGVTFYYGTTQFESTDARHAFPCYDEPGIRAPIGLQIQHGKSYNSYSNMPVESIEEVPDTDYVVTTFMDTPVMQTYLLAFLVSPFEYEKNNATDVPQRIFGRPELIENGHGIFAASISDEMLKLFESFFGVDYTLPKLDHAGITQFAAGAMENWGFITYRENYLLMIPNSTNVNTRKNIISIMAHEIAHQWFGNLVSPRWWSDLWLNEGFATLYEYHIPHLMFPEYNFAEDFRTSPLRSSLINDVPTNVNSVPMSYYVETPADIDRRFNFISYSKSGSVLRMFQEALSIPTFVKGLKNYLTKKMYQAAVPEDLFSAIQLAVDEDYPNNNLHISSIMGTWVFQAGYPIVIVDTIGSNLVLTQQRYPTGDGIYAVPLILATKSDPDFTRKTASLWLLDRSQEFSMSSIGMNADDWIILNNQQTGFYRVGYSNRMWRLIGQGLKENHEVVHLINRRILQEELYIGLTGFQRIQASSVLEMIHYFDKEVVPQVWNDAGNSIRYLNSSLFGTPSYPKYLNLITNITASHIQRLGYDPIQNEPTVDAQLRTAVRTFNCYSLDENCLNHELAKLRNFMTDSSSPAPDFCSAFRLADDATYYHFLVQLVTNTSFPFRQVIARTIQCTLDVNHLQNLLVMVDNDQNVLTTNERNYIVNSMFSTSTVGFVVAFGYLKENLGKFETFRNQVIATVNTQEVFDELKQMLEEGISSGLIEQNIAESTILAINENMNWQERNYGEISAWFDYHLNDVTTTSTTTTTTTTTSSTTTTTTPPGPPTPPYTGTTTTTIPQPPTPPPTTPRHFVKLVDINSV